MMYSAILAGAIGKTFLFLLVLIVLAIVGIIAIIKKVL
jgi:hypothetical protein